MPPWLISNVSQKMRTELENLLTVAHGKTSDQVKNAFFDKSQKAQKRDCVFTLKTALEEAESYLVKYPIVPYIASQRARWIINNANIITADFDLISEKEYLDKCLGLIHKLYDDSKEKVDEESKKIIDQAFAVQEVCYRIPDEIRIIREIGIPSALGARIVAIYTGKRVKTETKASPVLAFVLAIVGAFLGIFVGPIGFIIGLFGGGFLGIVISAQSSVDNASPDEQLDSQAEFHISAFKREPAISCFRELKLSIPALLSDPKKSQESSKHIEEMSQVFSELIKQE